MKPWLFDILACPIDKKYPLKLFIFSFENKLEEFQSYINIYNRRDIDSIKNEKIIKTYQINGKYFIKDNIILEKTLIKTYIKLIISSIDEFENVFDKTNNEMSKECFRLINSDIKSNILNFYNKQKFDSIENILPELYFINKLKLNLEIESGLLFCNYCKRWYPIIDTIPQMLPDKYRDKEKETEFLETNKNLLNEKFFNQDLKPFKI